MASYNKVLLMGNITRDIELRHTQTNMAVATIGLAVNRRFKTADGQMKEEVCFVDCDAWGKTAENMAKFFSKGRPVFIEGRLRLDQWEKDGAKHSKLKVVIEGFEFVDSKPGSGAEGASARPVVRTVGNGAPAAAPSGGDGGGEPAYEPIQEKDIPF